MKVNELANRLAGYAYLIEVFQIKNMPIHHQSMISQSNQGATIKTLENGRIEELYRSQYWPGDMIYDHLEFALKYDGIDLSLLSQIFKKINQSELASYIEAKPMGKYRRRLWFFYEFLMDDLLAVKDLSTGNYITALDEDQYETIKDGERSHRHRIINNLLGTKLFCPIVRHFEKPIDIFQQYEAIITQYPNELLRRALSYFYLKETKSSFEIEKVQPSSSKIQSFIALLSLAEKEDFCTKEKLITLQNQIVDQRFKAYDYRSQQNYVGQSIHQHQELIHFICPKPTDIHQLMTGLIQAHQRMKMHHVDPIVHASTIAYGFVYLHPFEDGNGRIHRFLIHNILALRSFTPKGLMFPISYFMLNHISQYDEALEAFSKPLLQLIDYDLDEDGHMTVKNDTTLWYQYIDMSHQTKILSEMIKQTIQDDLITELAFLSNYDQASKRIKEIVDLPNHLMSLLLKVCSHHGSLSVRKREAYFSFLTDQEVAQIEDVLRQNHIIVKNQKID
jgi:tetratricopeptide (TPR) repeat protein